MKKVISFALFIFLMVVYISCSDDGNKGDSIQSYGSEGWLSGSENERWNTVADQFAGFSATMMEVQYRFQELYWAGLDKNWGYALHQVEHIEEAIEAGLIRRPVRAASAESFLHESLPGLEKVLEAKDFDGFADAFELVRISCNVCHAKEEVPFIYVNTPTERQSTIRLPR